jgi:hypothetical protein
MLRDEVVEVRAQAGHESHLVRETLHEVARVNGERRDSNPRPLP